MVNISTSQTVTADNNNNGDNDGDGGDDDAPSQPMPKLPPGSPFEDFFNQFFNKDGMAARRNARKRPRLSAQDL